MPSSYFSTPLIFLIETLFGLYIALVALRLVMQWAQWEYHNPLVQFIIKATQVPVKFLRQFIPAIGKVDTATVVFLISLTLIKLLLISLLAVHYIIYCQYYHPSNIKLGCPKQ
jgi:YggT family protein